MTETDIDIIEFTEEFHWDWLNNKFRKNYLFGGIEDNVIPLRTGGYTLPLQVSQEVDSYLHSIYTALAGGGVILETQEVYDTVINRGVKYVQVQCKAMITEPTLVTS